MRKLVKNKKGNIGIIIFVSVILIILIMGFVAVISWAVIDIASDELTPIMEDLGMVDDVNLSEVSGYTFGVMDTFVQAMPWLISFAYVMSLLFTLAFIVMVGYNSHPALISFYFILMVLLIFGCIIISNMYQDIYDGSDELATRLHEQTIMTFLIVHSPIVMGIIMLIGGVLIFARNAGSEGAMSGGYGV